MTIEQFSRSYDSILQNPGEVIVGKLFPEIDRLPLLQYENEALKFAVLAKYTQVASLKVILTFQSQFNQIEESDISTQHKFVLLHSLQQLAKTLQTSSVTTTTTSSLLGKRREQGGEGDELIQFNPLISVYDLSTYVRGLPLSSQHKLALLICIYATKSQLLRVTSYASCVPEMSLLSDIHVTSFPDVRINGELQKCVESLKPLIKSSEFSEDCYLSLISKMPHYELISREDERYLLISKNSEIILAFSSGSEDKDLKIRAASLILKPQAQITVETTGTDLKATYLRLEEALEQYKKIEQVKLCYLKCLANGFMSVKKARPSILTKEDSQIKIDMIKEFLGYRYAFTDIRIYRKRNGANFVKWCEDKEITLEPQEYALGELVEKTIPDLYDKLETQKKNRSQIKELFSVLEKNGKSLTKTNFFITDPFAENALCLFTKFGQRNTFKDLIQFVDLLEPDEACKHEQIKTVMEMQLFKTISDDDVKLLNNTSKLIKSKKEFSKEEKANIIQCVSIVFKEKTHKSLEYYQSKSMRSLHHYIRTYALVNKACKKWIKIKEYITANKELFGEL